MEEGVVFTEFKSIPSGKASSSAESFVKDPSGLRDRKGVYPYHENRVTISRTAANTEGYINASFVKVGLKLFVSGLRRNSCNGIDRLMWLVKFKSIFCAKILRKAFFTNSGRWSGIKVCRSSQ